MSRSMERNSHVSDKTAGKNSGDALRGDTAGIPVGNDFSGRFLGVDIPSFDGHHLYHFCTGRTVLDCALGGGAADAYGKFQHLLDSPSG